MNHVLVRLLPVLVVLVSVAACADELETVVVTGRADASTLENVPGSVDAVDKSTLDLVQHSHINEAADRVSGTWISRGNGQESLTSIRSPVFTGPASCGSFIVLEDGIPTRPAGFCNVNELFEINSEQAQRLEIFKGPDSAVYGSNAEHGVINVLTPDITNTEDASLRGDVGPHDYRRVFASYNDPDSFRVDLHGDHDSGFIDDSGYDQQKLGMKFRTDHASFQQLNYVEATNLNQNTAGYLLGEGSYKEDNLQRTNSTPGAYRDASSVHGYSKLVFNAGQDNEFTITPYANGSNQQFVMHWIPTTPVEKSGEESVGLNGNFRYPLALAGNGARMVSGFNLETSRVHMDEYQWKPTSFGYVNGQHYDFDVFMEDASVFTQLEQPLAKLLTLVIGARYDYGFYDYTNHLPANTVGNYTRPANRNDEFGDWGANAGLLYDIADKQQMFLRLSTGFRVPQVDELYRLSGGQPDHVVQPEQIRSAELGWRGEAVPVIGKKLFYEISVYDMQKSNVIMQDGAKQYIGNGDTLHKGVELTMEYWMTDSFYGRLAGTYAEHRYGHLHDPIYQAAGNVDGKTIDTAPRHYGTLQLGHTYSWGLSELEVKHMGAYYLDPLHQHQYGGHNLLNWRTEWNVAKDARLDLRFTNLLNADYAERADVRPITNVPRYFVGEPRAAYLSLDKSF